MSTNSFLVGKDALRLLTTATYNEPLMVYREYIQNAIDSIDSAINDGANKEDMVTNIAIDGVKRIISIYDNGVGIPEKKFRQYMTSIGDSKKKTLLCADFGALVV